MHDIIKGWGDKTELVYLKRSGAGFSAPVPVNQSEDDFLYAWDVETDRNGKAHIVDEATAGVYYVNNASGQFESWKKIDSIGDPFNIEIDPNNTVHLAYFTGSLRYGNNKTGKFVYNAYDMPSQSKLADLFLALGGSNFYYFVFEKWRGPSSSRTGREIFLLKSSIK